MASFSTSPNSREGQVARATNTRQFNASNSNTLANQASSPGARPTFRKVNAAKSDGDEWVTVGPQQRSTSSSISVTAGKGNAYSSSGSATSYSSLSMVSNPPIGSESRHARPATQGATLFVAGVPPVYGVEQQLRVKEELNVHLSQWAPVKGIKLVYARQYDNHVKCAFAEFATAADANRVMEEAHGSNFRGMYLRLEPSRGDRTVRFEMTKSKLDMQSMSLCGNDEQVLSEEDVLAEGQVLGLTETLAEKLARPFGHIEAVDRRFADLGNGSVIDVVMSSSEEARAVVNVLGNLKAASGLKVGWAQFNSCLGGKLEDTFPQDSSSSNEGSCDDQVVSGPAAAREQAASTIKLLPSVTSSTTAQPPCDTMRPFKEAEVQRVMESRLENQPFLTLERLLLEPAVHAPTKSQRKKVTRAGMHNQGEHRGCTTSRKGVFSSAPPTPGAGSEQASQEKALEALKLELGISSYNGPWGSSEHNSPTIMSSTPKNESVLLESATSGQEAGRPNTSPLERPRHSQVDEEGNSTVSSAQVATPRSESGRVSISDPFKHKMPGNFATPASVSGFGKPTQSFDLVSHPGSSEQRAYDLGIIWVGHIGPLATDSDIRDFFSDCGPIKRVKTMRSVNGTSFYAFVNFLEDSSVDLALAKHGKPWKFGKSIAVRRKTKVSPAIVAKKQRASLASESRRSSGASPESVPRALSALRWRNGEMGATLRHNTQSPDHDKSPETSNRERATQVAKAMLGEGATSPESSKMFSPAQEYTPPATQTSSMRNGPAAARHAPLRQTSSLGSENGKGLASAKKQPFSGTRDTSSSSTGSFRQDSYGQRYQPQDPSVAAQKENFRPLHPAVVPPMIPNVQPYAVTWTGDRWLPVLPPMPTVLTPTDPSRMAGQVPQGYLTYEQYMLNMAQPGSTPVNLQSPSSVTSEASQFRPGPRSGLPMAYTVMGYPMTPFGGQTYHLLGEPSEFAHPAPRAKPQEQQRLRPPFNPRLAPFVPHLCTGYSPSMQDFQLQDGCQSSGAVGPFLGTASGAYGSQMSQPTKVAPNVSGSSPQARSPGTNSKRSAEGACTQKPPMSSAFHHGVPGNATRIRGTPFGAVETPSQSTPGKPSLAASGMVANYSPVVPQRLSNTESSCELPYSAPMSDYALSEGIPPPLTLALAEGTNGAPIVTSATAGGDASHVPHVRLAPAQGIQLFPHASFLGPVMQQAPAQPSPSQAMSPQNDLSASSQRIDIPAYMADY
ncbi:hypothetical protein K437DRAFT_295589 [Tilletiaria anomala UBC 951]|uniref:RRM domain-containing protein n=1 Tax=Tilletiaria anomala (strain ATCC 24038 / CBS 436.72 / UBC 951) TaxID=1037660 RepID=A0A066VRV2_TILAU|nr:uncharacterized protein K437DRAFT_295589 [Tilletiaria anomala UBC 951]KDN41529.1 hypothetical protein K437DRAFT_295589 [Tilletiaria anomala UBC 951]